MAKLFLDSTKPPEQNAEAYFETIKSKEFQDSKNIRK